MTNFDRTAFERTGAARFAGALGSADLADIEALSTQLGPKGAGLRLVGHPELDRLLADSGPLVGIARRVSESHVQPVRAVLFDKSDATNWSVAWHQDRTIAVQTRVEVEGFGPWSSKAGVQHVEPPFALIEAMVTLRAHLDPVDADNAPLLVAMGSHRLGRIPADRTAHWAADLEGLTCLAEPGDVWAYATPILHASERARLPRRRRVLQVDFSAMGLPGGLEWLGVA